MENENVKTYPLSSIIDEDQEEAHYHHVLMDVVELIYNYGWEPVLKDIIALKENKEW